ncbi:MAG TPA: HupE/UreJ family protein, partial [Gammaproteobacteria bacterium]|nr:HupE/UreJ family protein [Gammaproteobacteria bacterium]
MMRCLRGALLLAALAAAVPAAAHRLSPAYFGFVETAPDTFDVQWKVSVSGGLAAVLEPKLPEG